MTEGAARRIAFRVAGVYAVLAAVWIVLSDAALARMLHRPHDWQFGQTGKGLGFVVVTAVLLYEMVRRATEALARTEGVERRHSDELEALLAELPALVFTVDEDLRFRSVRGSLLARYGRDPESYVGRPAADVLGAEAVEKIRRALSNEESRYDYEWEGHSFEVAVRPLAEGAIAVGVEVTDERRARAEREELEERLRESEKIEAVGRLAGGIAHDFNNMLLAIRGYAELVLKEAEEGSRAAHGSAEILKAADRATALTRQLLAYSRRQILSPEVFDLAELPPATDAMLRRLVGERYRLEVERGEPALVQADRAQLEQVLVNLVLNARDAMPDGGRIVIRTGRIDRGGFPHAMLRVSDHGAGMARDTLEHVFEPFFTTKEQGRGTGLGLATVHGVVSQSGGGVDAESAPGLGSTFTVYLPLAERLDAPSAPARPVSDAPPTEETVLLVEDDPTVRGVVAQMLEEAGYRVLAARDGADAVAIAESEDVDVLVTDVVMPDVDGRELARLVAGARPGVRVLLMSGHVDRFANPQGHSLLEKPFSAAELVERVRRTASR